MENFQTYFPYSSSSAPLNVQANPPQTTNFNNYSTEFQDSKSNGYLDLMMPDVQHDPVSFDSKKNIISGNESYLGSENNEETKVEKKKGEKKVRKPRYAFQTRSHVDILDDGYRWRKYGQKAVKNNKFPRSYYRCTHQGCNVKKQVQRLTKDEGVVVTTYEGMHSHPIEKSTDNFEHILSQMQIYASY